ncbi:MAG TPA: exodeoxyribonuclease VII large subunit [Acidimicrobiales bacterium]
MTMPLWTESAGGEPRRVTLIRLAGEIARALGGVGRVAVEGEVYRPTTSRGGWVFFTLRDRAAQLDVKVPSGNVRRSRTVHGERVCVVGVLQWANDRGQVHLVAEEVTPVGEGAIAELIADTRRRLGGEGLLDRPRRPIPLLPAVIGVVCGTDAAVRRDIESVAAVRFPGYPLWFEETTVSGPGASLTIVEALEAVVSRPGVEVVIMARGGGDGPSLLPWSSEEVCRAVVACPVPVVSAIGHEGDRPLCDELADVRCGTPSIAAGVVVPDQAGLVGALDGRLTVAADLLQARLELAGRRLGAVEPRRALGQGVDRETHRLARYTDRLEHLHPSRRLRECRVRLGAVDWRRPTWEQLARAEGRLGAELRHLRALSPARTLERGYAVVTGPDGVVVRQAGSLRVGDPIAVRLAAGGVAATVTAIDADDGASE